MDDHRIKALEVDMRDVRDRLCKVEVKLDSVAAKFPDLATKDFVRTEVVASQNKVIVWIVGSGLVSPFVPQLGSAIRALLGH